jgi:hypothetical protein
MATKTTQKSYEIYIGDKTGFETLQKGRLETIASKPGRKMGSEIRAIITYDYNQEPSISTLIEQTRPKTTSLTIQLGMEAIGRLETDRYCLVPMKNHDITYIYLVPQSDKKAVDLQEK